jgi:NAD(P)-dependent dehydrogenase (short-subunit alcohol dehydrogenase family)
MGSVEGTVLVTGGTGALGSAVVAELLSSGARVVSTWVVEAERDRLASGLGDPDQLTLVEADLFSEGGAAAAVEAAGGELSALVNLVGGFSSGPRTHETDPGEMEKMLELNLMTAYRTTRAALPVLLARGGGSVVCMGTKTAFAPFSGGAAYSVSKAALIALVKALDVEYRGDGIRVNAVVPNIIDTRANREQMPDADYSTWVQPAQIAKLIRFLCSEDSAATSGAAIPVYGRAG